MISAMKESPIIDYRERWKLYNGKPWEEEISNLITEG